MGRQLEGVFCRAPEVPLAEIKLLLTSAPGQRFAESAAVVSAQAVYDDLSKYVVYVPFIGDDCDKHTAEAWTTADELRAFLESVATDVPAPLRPDADHSAPDYGLPTGVTGLLGLGLAAYIISKIAPYFGRKGKK